MKKKILFLYYFIDFKDNVYDQAKINDDENQRFENDNLAASLSCSIQPHQGLECVFPVIAAREKTIK